MNPKSTDNLIYLVRYVNNEPTHYIILRNLTRNDIVVTRILDFYGNFSDRNGSKEIILSAVYEAIKNGSSQVTVLSTLPILKKMFLGLGFIARSKVRFCWQSSSSVLMRNLEYPSYWCLADSDNDEIY